MPSQAVIKQCLFAHFDEKTAWQAWGAMDDVMAAFQALSTAPVVDVVDEVMPIIFLSDKSAWIMYDCTSTFRKVNDARRDLFPRKGRYIEAIPPTSDALIRFPVERDTTQDSTKMS